MLHRSPRELMRSLRLSEFNAYVRLMLDRQREQAEAEAEAEAVDLADLSESEFAAMFGAKVPKAQRAQRAR